MTWEPCGHPRTAENSRRGTRAHQEIYHRRWVCLVCHPRRARCTIRGHYRVQKAGFSRWTGAQLYRCADCSNPARKEPTQRTVDRIEDIRWMHANGESLNAIAVRLGIKRNSLDTFLLRWRVEL